MVEKNRENNKTFSEYIKSLIDNSAVNDNLKTDDKKNILNILTKVFVDFTFNPVPPENHSWRTRVSPNAIADYYSNIINYESNKKKTISYLSKKVLEAREVSGSSWIYSNDHLTPEAGKHFMQFLLEKNVNKNITFSILEKILYDTYWGADDALNAMIRIDEEKTKKILEKNLKSRKKMLVSLKAISKIEPKKAYKFQIQWLKSKDRLHASKIDLTEEIVREIDVNSETITIITDMLDSCFKPETKNSYGYYGHSDYDYEDLLESHNISSKLKGYEKKYIRDIRTNRYRVPKKTKNGEFRSILYGITYSQEYLKSNFTFWYNDYIRWEFFLGNRKEMIHGMLISVPYFIESIEKNKQFEILETLLMLIFQSERGYLKSDGFHYATEAIKLIRHDIVIPFYDEMHNLCINDFFGNNENYSYNNYYMELSNEYKEKYNKNKKIDKLNSNVKDKLLDDVFIKEINSLKETKREESSSQNTKSKSRNNEKQEKKLRTKNKSKESVQKINIREEIPNELKQECKILKIRLTKTVKGKRIRKTKDELEKDYNKKVDDLKEKCRKLKVRLTKNINGKRVYKTRGELQKDYDLKVKENHEKERQKAIENIKYQFSRTEEKNPLISIIEFVFEYPHFAFILFLIFSVIFSAIFGID